MIAAFQQAILTASKRYVEANSVLAALDELKRTFREAFGRAV